MDPTALRVILWVGGLTIALISTLVGFSMKRLWGNVDGNSVRLLKLGEKINKVELNVASEYVTSTEFISALREVKDEVKTGFAEIKTELAHQRGVQAKIFDKLEETNRRMEGKHI
jgi:hypothetical protein